MTEIKRFDLNGGSFETYESADGDYVDYDDHAAIVSSKDDYIKSLSDLLEARDTEITRLERENISLQEQVQKLTEERDSATLQFDYMQDQINFHSEKVKELTWEKESALIECAAAKIAVQYLQHDAKAKFTLNTPKTDSFIQKVKARDTELTRVERENIALKEQAQNMNSHLMEIYAAIGYSDARCKQDSPFGCINEIGVQSAAPYAEALRQLHNFVQDCYWKDAKSWEESDHPMKIAGDLISNFRDGESHEKL